MTDSRASKIPRSSGEKSQDEEHETAQKKKTPRKLIKWELKKKLSSAEESKDFIHKGGMWLKTVVRRHRHAKVVAFCCRLHPQKCPARARLIYFKDDTNSVHYEEAGKHCHEHVKEWRRLVGRGEKGSKNANSKEQPMQRRTDKDKRQRAAHRRQKKRSESELKNMTGKHVRPQHNPPAPVEKVSRSKGTVNEPFTSGRQSQIVLDIDEVPAGSLFGLARRLCDQHNKAVLCRRALTFEDLY